MSMRTTDDPNSSGWIHCASGLPKDGEVVETKIHDRKGVRNEQTLKRQGRLWFYPDGSMYVYYTPTHWKEVSAPASRRENRRSNR